jgi:hypothetical protein
VDGARRRARSFVLAALWTLHLARLLVAVRDGDYPRGSAEVKVAGGGCIE